MAATALQCVDLVRADGAPTDGLVPVHGAPAGDRRDEAAILEEARHLKNIDYVFFRRFSDGRSSQAAAFVVDNSDERLTDDDLAKLHVDVWRQGISPLLYVARPTQVDVLTCASGPDFWHEGHVQYRPVANLEHATRTAAEVDSALQKKRRRFSALRLANGTFWDDVANRKLARHRKAAHQLLINAVVEADHDLEGDKNPVLRRLLMLTVLIKYLEDRRVFPEGWFDGFCSGASTFFEVLRDGEPDDVRLLLGELEDRFNGDVFQLPDVSEGGLTRERLQTFARLVEARTLGRQQYLWEQYSFEHLPVEVVSRLYQRFVKGGHGVVYTPPFLASLLLDYAMPYDRLSGEERVLDPACGSGVFLVGAFRRLVTAWRSRNKWQPPDVATLKRIVGRSIFGIELDAGAVDLTAFSLALAICDCLKPDVIWEELCFDPLRGKNLIEGDFFHYVAHPDTDEYKAWPDKFDVVIGNPPFESKLTAAGDALNKEMLSERGRLPDKQAAYLFLEQGFRALKPGANLCLIQRHSFLHNTNVADFRRGIFAKHRVSTVLDFISIRKLYEGADANTVAIHARAAKPRKDNWITHLTFRRTFSVLEQVGFELDHYDYHRVPQPLAESDPLVWRINLLGGGRLQEIAGRLRSMRTLKEYVDSQGWDAGEGFIAGKQGKRKTASFLTGKPLLPTEALSESGIDESQIETLRETRFVAPRKKKRYCPPLLLIKEHSSLPMAFWDRGPLVYRDQIVGVHAEVSTREALQACYRTLKHRQSIYRFCCALNGSKDLMGRATAILKRGIDALPYPEDPSELTFSFWEDALKDDVLDYMRDFIRLGQNSDLLKVSATKAHLSTYAEMFCRLLGSVYDNLKPHDPVRFDGLICQPFYFGEHPRIDWFDGADLEALRKLVYDDSRESLRTRRMVRFYAENVILIVKPDRMRYWIRSTAIRDADETLVDLRNQGL